MNSTTHSILRFCVVALTIALVGPAPALAAEKCDPLLADGSTLESVRTDIENACPCGGFDGSDGHGRSDYKRCVGEQIQTAVEGEVLRKACKSSLKKMFAASICGLGRDDFAPCVETTNSGKVRCKILSAATCQERSGDVCGEAPNCVAAADTTGDLIVDTKDSGTCIPATPTTTSTTSTTSSTTSTSTTIDTTTTTMEPVLCGEGSPDIHIEVDRNMDNFEVVQETDCRSQSPSGGGCALMNNVDGSMGITNSFYADGSTDERVCSQEDAALAYHWDILLPPTLQGAVVRFPWIVGGDSPVLELPPSALPIIADTDAGADIYWRARLTVTPLPLEGEEITPAPSVRYFRFQYDSSEMYLHCSDYLQGHDFHCDETCRRDYCGTLCSAFPERCQP